MKASENQYPYITATEQGSTPPTPSSGDQRLFIDDSDHLLYLVDSTGTVTPVGGAGGSIDVTDGSTTVSPTTSIEFTSGAAVTDGGGGIAQVAISGGGGGGGWDLDLDADGSTFSGWTSLSGTWASNGTVIQQTNGGGAYVAVRTAQVIDASYFIAECEIRFPASGQPSAPNYAGVVLGMPATDADSMMNVSLTRNTPGEVRFDNYGHTNIIAAPATIALDTWYTLRCIASAGNFSAYLDGTRIGTAHSNYSLTNYDVSYLGLRTSDAKVDFRNIKLWNPTQP